VAIAEGGPAGGTDALSLPPAPVVAHDLDERAVRTIATALASACELEPGLGCCITKMVIADGHLTDLEVVAADATMARLMPGLAPGVRGSQLLPPDRLHGALWQVWSHQQLRITNDNRDNAAPELLSGAVFEAVQLVAGTTVVWLALDHSQRQHWQDRAMEATEAATEAARISSEQLLRITDQLFDLLVTWTLVRDGDGTIIDAVISHLNEAAHTLVARPVQVGRRISELVAPQYLAAVLGYLAHHTTTTDVDSRVFGPDDLEVHLVQALHGRVRVFGTGPDTVMALFTDDTALTEVAAQARHTLQRLARTRDDEGRRLAARLHDGPLQALAATRWRVETAAAELSDVAYETLLAVQASLDTIEEALRAEIFTLSPPSLETTGVFVAIAELAERCRTTDRDVTVVLNGESQLGRDDETLLVRCVQELLRNIDQHTRSTTVGVDVTANATAVTVTVVDDGDGFDASDPSVWLGREHFGLSSCKLLLELAGGGMWVESAPGQGTRSVCWLPQPQLGAGAGPQGPGADKPAAADPQTLWQASLRAAALRRDFEQRYRHTPLIATGDTDQAPVA
jgi:signal transduction histidine kinase